MIEILIDRRWRVRASTTIHTTLPTGAVWGQMRDLARFLTIDPLHARVLTPPRPAAAGWRGAPLVIEHRLAGLGPDRVGRVLAWNEGRGYSVSDLSRRGARKGFPHICSYEVRPSGSGSVVTVSARGVWTATVLPRWVAGLWLRWVLASTAAHIQRDLAAFARWREARERAGGSGGDR